MITKFSSLKYYFKPKLRSQNFYSAMAWTQGNTFISHLDLFSLENIYLRDQKVDGVRVKGGTDGANTMDGQKESVNWIDGDDLNLISEHGTCSCIV